MQYLYVCHFSNGHIKVGRSSDPKSRIAEHEERVSCLGVELVESNYFECVGHVIPSETALINRCAGFATKRNKSEWFEGLDFETVRAWADEIANTEYVLQQHDDSPKGGMTKKTAIALLGGTPSLAAKAMGYKAVQAIYMWPDVLPQSVADRVGGVLSRTQACAA